MKLVKVEALDIFNDNGVIEEYLRGVEYINPEHITRIHPWNGEKDYTTIYLSNYSFNVKGNCKLWALKLMGGKEEVIKVLYE